MTALGLAFLRFRANVRVRSGAKCHNESLTRSRSVIEDDMKGWEKSITSSLAAVTVRSAAIQSSSSLSSIPTRPSYGFKSFFRKYFYDSMILRYYKKIQSNRWSVKYLQSVSE